MADRQYVKSNPHDAVVIEAAGASPMTGFLHTLPAEGNLPFLGVLLDGHAVHARNIGLQFPPIALDPEMTAALISELYRAADQAGWGPRLRADVEQLLMASRDWHAEHKAATGILPWDATLGDPRPAEPRATGAVYRCQACHDTRDECNATGCRGRRRPGWRDA